MQQLPTTQEARDVILARIESELGKQVPFLPKSPIRVIATALAGSVALVYKYVAWVLLQQFVRTAEFNTVNVNGVSTSPLIEWGILIGVGPPKPAKNAVLTIKVNVNTAAQTGFIPKGEQLVAVQNNFTYQLLDVIDLTQVGEQVVTVRSVQDPNGDWGAGAESTLEIGSALNFVNRLSSNLDNQAIVDSVIDIGIDQESEINYRDRVLEKFQVQPQGGATIDYRLWSREVPGVLQAYPYTDTFKVVSPPATENLTYGASVEIFIQSTADIDPFGIAPQQLIDDVFEYLNNTNIEKTPIGTFTNIKSIERITFDFEIYNLVVSDPVTTKAQINETIAAYLSRIRPFIFGVDRVRNDAIDVTAVLTAVYQVVAQDPSYSDPNNLPFAVIVKRNGFVIPNKFIPGRGQLPKIGSITYIDGPPP